MSKEIINPFVIDSASDSDDSDSDKQIIKKKILEKRDSDGCMKVSKFIKINEEKIIYYKKQVNKYLNKNIDSKITDWFLYISKEEYKKQPII